MPKYSFVLSYEFIGKAIIRREETLNVQKLRIWISTEVITRTVGKRSGRQVQNVIVEYLRLS